jgi:hypothetical protein
MEKEPSEGGVEQAHAPRGQAFVFGAFLFNVDRALSAIAEAPRETRPVQVAAWARHRVVTLVPPPISAKP